MAKITLYRNDILQIFAEDLPFERFSNCNILVTGATGLIGGCLVECLMLNPNRSYHVYASGRDIDRGLMRHIEYKDDPFFHFISYDVTKPLKLDICFDYIIHAASNASPNYFANNPVEVMKANIIGVINLMDYGLAHGMKRMLYVSSGEVYGEGDGRVVVEDYSGFVNCTEPRSCYPSSERAAETLCVSYCAEYGADVVIARPCHTYGPYFTENDNRVYAQFLRNILSDEDIIMKSRGEQFRSWCYVVDCVSALLYILLKGQCGQAYNIADNNSNISIRKLAEIIASTGRKKVVFDVPDEEEKKGYGVIKKAVFSNSKISRLGWQAKTSISEGIIKTIEQIRGI